MKLFINIVGACILLGVIAASVFGYFVFIDGMNAITYTTMPFKTDRTEYRAGDRIGVIRNACSDRTLSFTTQASIVDGFVLSYPTFTGFRQKGCTEKTSIDLEIPKILPVGQYHIQGQTTYQVNRFKTITLTWTTVPFQVIK